MISDFPVVFDNIIFSLQKKGGISRFWANLISNQPRFPRVAFLNQIAHNKNIYCKDISFGTASEIFYERKPIIFSRYINPRKDFFSSKYIFHSSYYRVNYSSHAVNVTTIHDLMYEKYLSGLRYSIHIAQKKKALAHSDCIVCVSENTKKDLFEIYPFCKTKRVEVIGNGVSGFRNFDDKVDFSGSWQEFNENSYFLYVGNRGHCKGFSLVHNVIDLLGREVQCLVVGEPFTREENKRILQMGHEKLIKNLGVVNDSLLNLLYAKSKFFFFPSIYEGFGIPLLEAMSSGALILAARTSSIPGILQDAGVYFNPHDTESLKNALSTLERVDSRNYVDRGVEIVKSFSWSAVAKKYDDLYSDL